MNLVFITFALSTFGNATNQTHVNHTYQVVLEQFNSSNCTVPFNQYSFEFNCSTEYNSTDCCLDEYNKLNTSYGSMQCNQYDVNDTYLTFGCERLSGSKSNSKQNPYIVAGIAVGSALVLILVISSCIMCLRSCHRSRYNRI